MPFPFLEKPKKRTVTRKNPSKYPQALRKTPVLGAMAKQIRENVRRLKKHG